MRRWATIAIAVLTLVPANSAQAQDLNTELAAAQAAESEAQAAIAAAQPKVQEAARKLRPIVARAEKASAKADAALERVDSAEAGLIAQREQAAEAVAELEASYEDDKEAHDETRYDAIGLALGAALLALIPFFWTQVRKSLPVRWLADQPLGMALGVVVGGALVALLVGAALLSGSGFGRAIGGMLIVVSLGLAVALFVARHSVRVEREQSTPLLSRDRRPRWVALLIAGLLALLAVGALGDGLLSEGPDEPNISEDLRQLAEAAEGDPTDPPTETLTAVREAAEPLVAAARKAEKPFREAQSAYNEAKQQLTAAKNQLREAQRDITRLATAIEEEAEQAALAAARAAERAEEEAAAQALSAPSGGGSTSYENCDSAPSNIPVPPGSDLDADGDGIGCES